MSDTQYVDIIRKVLEEDNYENAELYIDGGDEERYVLVLNSSEYVDLLNKKLEKELKDNNIDTYPDYVNRNDWYIDIASGYNWGFYDEYWICSNCGKAFAYETGYGYNKFWLSDYGIYCENCVKEDPSEYVESLINNPETANIILNEKELNSFGFYKYNSDERYANGFYDKHDNPRELYNTVKNESNDVIFSLYENYNPYEEEFDIYTREI